MHPEDGVNVETVRGKKYHEVKRYCSNVVIHPLPVQVAQREQGTDEDAGFVDQKGQDQQGEPAFLTEPLRHRQNHQDEEKNIGITGKLETEENEAGSAQGKNLPVLQRRILDAPVMQERDKCGSE